MHNRKLCGKKNMHNQLREPQPYEGLSSKIDSRICVNFTRTGLGLVSRHQEPPHTKTVSRNLATVVVRGVLPGLRRRTGLLSSGPKPSFQMRVSFVFHLETKVLESRGRVEKLISPSSLKSSVKFPQFDDLGCNVICWCWSIVFFENRHCTRLSIHFGALHASFC